MKTKIMEIFEKEIMEDPLHKFTTLIDTTDTTVPGLVEKRMVFTHHQLDLEFAYAESVTEEADNDFTDLTIISLAAETRTLSAPIPSIVARRSRPQSAPAAAANAFSSVKARYLDKPKRPVSAPHTFSKPRRKLHSLQTFTSLSLRDSNSNDLEEGKMSIAAVPYRLRELLSRSSTSKSPPISKSPPPKQLTLVNLQVGVDVSNANHVSSSPKLLAVKSSKKKRPAVDWQDIFGNAPFRPISGKSKEKYCAASGNHVSVVRFS